MKIIKLSATSSTNSYLKSLLKEVSIEDETVISAREQTAGRGQQGALWQSQTGKSLAFSVFKRFNSLAVSQQFVLSMAVSLAVQDALNRLGVPSVTVKWPNDILSDNKKICGILIENTIEGSQIASSIIGIGVNVNQIEFDNLPRAGSLKMCTGASYDLDEVLQKVASAIVFELNKLTASSISEVKQRYETLLFKKNSIAVFENSAGERFNACIIGVSNMGQLIIQTEDELQQQYNLKEISLLY